MSYYFLKSSKQEVPNFDMTKIFCSCAALEIWSKQIYVFSALTKMSVDTTLTKMSVVQALTQMSVVTALTKMSVVTALTKMSVVMVLD